MDKASSLIAKALRDSPEILASGKQSVLAIAARALVPNASLSKQGISEALGLGIPPAVDFCVEIAHYLIQLPGAQFRPRN